MPDFSDKPLFHESQKFRQLWIWAIMGFSAAVLILTVAMDLLTSQDILQEVGALFAVGMSGVMLVVGLALMGLAALQTEVRHDGWYYRWWPFHRKYRKIKWEEVEKFEIKKYKPIADFGGYGYRIGMFGKGTAYNAQGNTGIQLFLRNGKKILFGTQSPEELRIALEHLFSEEDDIEMIMDLDDPEKIPLYKKELREDLLDD